MKEKNINAALLGVRGGLAKAKKYDKKHYQDMQKKAVRSRKENKLKVESSICTPKTTCYGRYKKSWRM